MHQVIAVLFLAIAVNSQPSDPVLLAQRLYTAEIGTVRSRSLEQLNHFFTDNFTTPNFGHGVVGVGLSKPREKAYEYDSLLFVLDAIIGYRPALLQGKWDRYTIQWDGPDVLIVDYFADVKTDYNFATGKYNIIADNLRYRSYNRFVPGTAILEDILSFPEPAETAIFESVNADPSPEAICYGIIFPACQNTPYFSDIQYTDPLQCVQFLYTLAANNRNPYLNSANTTACRYLHGIISLMNPSKHCEHTSIDSSMCRDRSNGLCDTCHQFAVCTGDISTTNFTTSFGCKCKPGFKGDGFNCVPQNCTASWQCGLDPGTGSCHTGICTCADSFTWDPIRAKCVCPSPNKVFWNNKVATCHRPGRCSEDWQCERQASNEVKCRSVGDNIYVEKACLCNRGFNGGIEYGCVCDGGRKVWSDIDAGNVCIKGTQCTENWHCSGRKICVGANASSFGTCQ